MFAATRRLLAALLAIASGITAAQNLVVNGDFARGGDPPPGWVREKETAAKGTIRVVDGVLEIAPNGANTPSAKPLGIGQAIDATALAGKSLSVSAQLGMRSPATGAVVGLHALRSDGSEIGHVHLRGSQAGGALSEQTGTLTIPPDEKPKLLILFAVAEGTGGTALFDSIRVATGIQNPAARAPAAPASASAAAAPAPSGYAVRVAVDAAARGRTIPRGLYGVNIEWWRNANGLWDEGADRLTPELVAYSKSLGTTLIRFPGGFLGDTYNWKEAVGPRKSRRPQVSNPSSGEKSPPNLGTDEAIQFAGAIGADLLLTANVGTGTAKLAADWVRYMKEAHQRNPNGPRVQGWEIGNEVYHKGDASGGSMTPEAYADKLRDFAREIRAVDPQARIGAIGLENYPTFPFNSHRNWTEVVMKRAGADIDFYSVHNGYAPVAPDDNANPREVYQALWAAPLMIADNLRLTAEQIRRYAPRERADQIRIAVTEWAPLFHVLPSSAWIDHSKTLGSALFVADTLRVFVQDDRVDIATFFKLNEPSFLGLLGVRGNQWIRNASYFAFLLYTRHFGTIVVSSRAEGPTYDNVKAGIVPAMKRVPLLESLASLSDDGSVLYVMLINKSIDTAADIELALNAFNPGAGTAHLLTGASPDSNTGSELPRVPGIRWARQVNVDAAKHFDRGSPAEISFTSTPLQDIGRPLRYRLPPHSVVSLELRLKR